MMQHSTTPLPTALLPTEVIEEVIDQASNYPHTLRRLTLLCKSLLTRARIHLFATIVIRSVEQMDSSSEFFDSHPWVLALVRKVILLSDIPHDYSKPHVPLLDMIRVHLFTRLPNLRVWEMRTEGSWSTPRLSLNSFTLLCYRIYGSRIKNLELAEIRIQGVSHFVRLISAFTSLQSLICSEITLPDPKEDQTSLHASELNPDFKLLAKPLTIRHLSVAMSVDIRLIEYLLGSSLATLASLSMSLDLSPVDEDVEDGWIETYFERLEESLSRLSELSELKLVISNTLYWTEHNDPASPVERMRWATRILRHVRKPSPPRNVQVQFDMERIADLGTSLYGGLPSKLEACTELEEVLLTFPSCNLRLCLLQLNYRRAGRPEFWSPTIKSAFPKLNERGLLSLPYTHPSSDPFGHEDRVTCLVALNDNKRIMTASWDGTIIIWDMELGIVEQQWCAHQGLVRALGVSPNSQRVVSAGGDHGETLIIWDIRNGVSKVTFLASIDTVIVDCAWSPDGTLIALGCEDGTIHICDALTFQQRGLLPFDHQLKPRPYFPAWLQWSADSQSLAWICATYIPKEGTHSSARVEEWSVWSPFAEEPPKRFPSYPPCSTDFYHVYGLWFDPKSKYAAAILGNQNLNDIWRHDGPIEYALGEDGSLHKPYPECLHVRDVVTGTMVADLDHPGVIGVHFSPDSESLLSISRDGSVKIWDMDDWHEIALLRIDGRGMKGACFSPSGEYVATICNLAEDNGTTTVTLRLWRLGEAPQCVAVFTEHKLRVDHLEFSPDGKFLVSGDFSGIIHIHRLSSFIGH